MLASSPARHLRSRHQCQLPHCLSLQYPQLPLQRHHLQLLPHSVDRRQGVLCLFRVNLLARAPLVMSLAKLYGVVVEDGETLASAVPLRLASAVEPAHLLTAQRVVLPTLVGLRGLP